jgi:hypothetical protein
MATFRIVRDLGDDAVAGKRAVALELAQAEWLARPCAARPVGSARRRRAVTACAASGAICRGDFRLAGMGRIGDIDDQSGCL